MIRLRTFLRNQAGSAAAEMALSVPLMLALLIVMFEGGHYFFIEHQISKGVRDGARFASRQSFTKYTCGTVDATLATQIKEVTRTGVVSGGSPRVYGWDNTEVTVTASCPATAVTTGIYKGLANAPRVRVSANVPYPSLFSTLGLIGPSGIVYAANEAPVVGI